MVEFHGPSKRGPGPRRAQTLKRGEHQAHPHDEVFDKMALSDLILLESNNVAFRLNVLW